MIGRPKFVLARIRSPRRLALVNQAGIEPDAQARRHRRDTAPGRVAARYANRLAHAKAVAALDGVKLDDGARRFHSRRRHGGGRRHRRILPRRNCSMRRRNACVCFRPKSSGAYLGLSGDAERSVPPAAGGNPCSFQAAGCRTRTSKAISPPANGAAKAGGYAAQGIAGSFIVKIVGSYSNGGRSCRFMNR